MINFDNNFKKFLENIIFHETNFKLNIEKIAAVQGGDINQTYKIESANVKYFIKLNSRENHPFFKAELVDLIEINNTKSILTPAPIATDVYKEHSFLILEYIDFDVDNPVKNLAENLAALHFNSKNYFGYKNDNFIGSIKQKNDKNMDWIEFFKNNRINFQIKLLEQKYNIKKLKKKLNNVFRIMPKLFQNYSPKASLLHGDLWQGNYGFNHSGQAIIFDPACYYGDHEVDLAMMELFSNPGQEFIDCYHQYFPIDAGYSKRKILYNLYHILNHANMFGDHYLNQAEMMLDQIIDSA